MGPCISSYFSNIDDPRIERKKLHSLSDILILTICAMLSGADGYEAVEEFGRNKKQWLKGFLPLKNGIPSHDCIRYVLIKLPPEQLQSAFIAWANAIKEKIPEVIAVDGKTAKGSQKRGLAGLHMVSAWGSSNKLVLGQEVTQEKSNEITAIPALLKLLELEGCIVTIDAMGCQLNIAEQIIEQKADYVLGLKGNQGLLHKDVKKHFKVATESKFKNIPHSYHKEVENKHGRQDSRQCWVLEAPDTLHRAEKWKGLQSIGMIKRESITGDKVTIETRYFIGSIQADAKVFSKAVRSHWGVENNLHWCLDVTFREDESRIRTGYAPACMSMFRHICLNLLQKETSKSSIKKKRLKSAWNDGFRFKVLFGL